MPSLRATAGGVAIHITGKYVILRYHFCTALDCHVAKLLAMTADLSLVLFVRATDGGLPLFH